jgi:methionine-rich copper-binding protein CopC
MKFKIITLAALACLFFANQAMAHATPVSYAPESGKIFETLPQTLEIVFTERVEPDASSITVYGPDGSRVESNVRVFDADAHMFRADLKSAGTGTYAVAWQVVSADDGHFSRGGYNFSVGQQSVNPNVQSSAIEVAHSSTWPEALAIASELIGQAMLLGTIIVFAFLVRKFIPSRQKAEVIYSRLVKGGVFLVIMGAVVYLVYKATLLQSQAGGEWFVNLLKFMQTQAGRHTIFRLAMALVLLGTFASFKKKIFAAQRFSAYEAVLLVLVLGMQYSRAAISHAAAQEFYPLVSVVVNMLHLTFKEMWVGSVIAFFAFFKNHFELVKDVAQKMRTLVSLSRLLSIAIGLAGVTGVYVIWLHLKSPANILTTGWGTMFILLSLFGGIMFAARLYHMFIVEGKFIPNKSFFPRLSFSFPFEMIAGIALLTSTGFIIITTPPADLKPFSQSTLSQGASVTLGQEIAGGNQLILATSDQESGEETEISNLVVTLTNQEKSIGPVVASVTRQSPGAFVMSVNELAPPGNWRIEITGQRTNAYDVIASFDLNTSELFPEHKSKSFDVFTVIMIISAIGVLFGATVLYYVTLLSFKKSDSASNDILLYERQAWLPPVFIIAVLLFLLFQSHAGLLKVVGQNCEGGEHAHHQGGPKC